MFFTKKLECLSFFIYCLLLLSGIYLCFFLSEEINYLLAPGLIFVLK